MSKTLSNKSFSLYTVPQGISCESLISACRRSNLGLVRTGQLKRTSALSTSQRLLVQRAGGDVCL